MAVVVPPDWRQIGFSGAFHIDAVVADTEPAALDSLAAQLPAQVPFGTNSGWLALRLNREVDPPTVTLVRKDAAAIWELCTTRPPHSESIVAAPANATPRPM